MHVDMHSEIARMRHQEAIARAERYRLINMAKGRREHDEQSPRKSLRTAAHGKAIRWAALSSVIATGTLLVLIN